jgi:hypothetical protein
MGLGEASLGERVRGGLVIADVQQIGPHAELVERSTEEQFVRRQAGQVELPAGMSTTRSAAEAR